MGQILRFLNFVCLATFVGLFTACGSTGSSNTTSTSTPGVTSGSGGSGSTGSGTGSSGSGGSGGSGSGSGSSASFVAYAYTASASEIRAYGVNSDGSLAAVSGSPYAASLENSSIVTNGSNLYAIAEDQNNVDIYSINNSSGALALASTASNQNDVSGGLALDHTGSSLYVSVGCCDENGGVSVFTVGSGSTAQRIQFANGPAIQPSPLVFSPNNQFTYFFGCSARVEGVFGYTRATDGTLTSFNPGQPTPPTGNSGEAFCPERLAVSAKGDMAILWVPFAFASRGQVGTETYVMTYAINSDGTLTAIANSQVKTASSAQNKVALKFDPTGSVLAVAGDGGVQTYSLNGTGTLTPAGAPLNVGVTFQNVAWDNSNHVFATSSTQLYVYNSMSGVLTPAAGSPNAGDPNLAVLPLR